MKIFPLRIPSLVLISLICASAAYAGEGAEDIVARLQKKYDAIRDASVTFDQSTVFGVTNAEQSVTGKLFMKKGNKYRIETESQTTVTDGKSVWSYAKANKQVLIDKYKEDPKSFSPDKILVNVPDNYTSIVLGKEKVGGDRKSVV